MRGRHGGHLGWWRVSLGSRRFFSALWAEQGWACEPRGSAGLERRAEGLRWPRAGDGVLQSGMLLRTLF